MLIVEHVVAQNLSIERLSRYLRECDNDTVAAVQLHEFNLRASSAMYETLAHVEIVVRSAWNRGLKQWSLHRFGDDDWHPFASQFLSERGVRDVQVALNRVAKKRYRPSPDRVTSELGFGFWRYLFSARYRTTLWPWVGQHIFETATYPVAQLASDVARLHELRNRIAHHEPIIYRGLTTDLDTCCRVVASVSPVTASWVRSQSRLAAVIEANERH